VQESSSVMCPPDFSSAFCVRRTRTAVCSLVLSVGSTAPAATGNRHEHSRLCVLHYTWHRLPHLNQFTASCRQDLCITGFILNFGLLGSASQPPCTQGPASVRPSLHLPSFVYALYNRDSRHVPADDILCMWGCLTSRFKRNNSTPLINRTGIGVFYGSQSYKFYFFA